MIAIRCTLYSIRSFFFLVLGVILHPRAKLFVPFIDNVMMIVVDSKNPPSSLGM